MRKLKIDFRQTKRFSAVNYFFKRTLRRAILATLAEEEFPYNARVSLTLCDNEYIHGLNKTYRSVDRATDVLSFPLYEDGEFDGVECGGYVELGDIVLSLERALEQASELGHSLLREAAFLVIHSTLHLLGYDHERSAEEDELQCEKQRKIISVMESRRGI